MVFHKPYQGKLLAIELGSITPLPLREHLKEFTSQLDVTRPQRDSFNAILSGFSLFLRDFPSNSISDIRVHFKPLPYSTRARNHK